MASTSSGVWAGNTFSVFPVAGLMVAKGMSAVLPAEPPGSPGDRSGDQSGSAEVLGDGPPHELAGGRVGQVAVAKYDLGRLYGASRADAAARRASSAGPRRAAVGDVGDADPLAPLLVGEAEDRHLGDALDGGQDVLDLGRVHVDAPADDEVVAPAGQVEEAVRVEPAEVADGAGFARSRRRRWPRGSPSS